MVNSLNIKTLIGEATEYDKKLSLEAKKPKSWCKSVSAFANTLGGALIFGIADDEKMVGLEDPNADAEKISEIIKTRLDPIPEFRLRFERTEEGKVLIILDIFKGDETPYYYSGDGVLEAYIRVGNESVKATATELKGLYYEAGTHHMIHKFPIIGWKTLPFQSLEKDIRNGQEIVSMRRILFHLDWPTNRDI